MKGEQFQQPIFVKPLSGPTILIHTHLNRPDGVQILPYQLEKVLGVPAAHQRILFGGKQLWPLSERDSGKSLRDYGVEREATIHLTMGLLGGLKVRVETLGKQNNSASIQVNPTDKIIDVKMKIHEALGIPPEEQELAHSGLPLEDDKLAFSYEFSPDSLIHLIVKDRREGAFQIFVLNPAGKTILLDVHPAMRVEQLKLAVQEKEGVPPDEQRFIFGGKELVDGKALSEYDIQPNSTLHMTLRLFGGWIRKL